jgi:hypothetical protein
MRPRLNAIFLLVVLGSISVVTQASAGVFIPNITQIPIAGNPSIVLLGVGLMGLVTIRRK